MSVENTDWKNVEKGEVLRIKLFNLWDFLILDFGLTKLFARSVNLFFIKLLNKCIIAHFIMRLFWFTIVSCVDIFDIFF